MAKSDNEDISVIMVSSRSDSVIIIDNSLSEDSQCSLNGGMEERQDLVQIPKYPLLESISARFAQNRQEQAERIRANKTKREVELAHSQYLKRNVASPAEVAAARPIVKAWADKNDVVGKEQRRQINARRRITSLQSDSVNILADTGCNAGRTMHNSTGQCHSRDERAPAHESMWSTTQQNDFVNIPQEPENLVCSVINCGARFSSWPRLSNHENQFAHSPCNPLIEIEDTKLPVDPICYMCSACDVEFMERDRCLQHISEMDHLQFYPPIEVGAYMCPQCFLLFISFSDCYKHFESSGHKSISYAFSEDTYNGDIMPVPVAMEMARDFCDRCQSVEFYLQCWECDLPITSPKALRNHQTETNGQHLPAALTNSSLMEIFASYLKPGICPDCKTLCFEEDQKNNAHYCPNGKSGQIVINACKSFTDFVKCCGLTLMKARASSKLGTSDKHLGQDSKYPCGKLDISYQKSSKLGTSDKHLGSDSKYPCGKLEISYQKSSKLGTADKHLSADSKYQCGKHKISYQKSSKIGTSVKHLGPDSKYPCGELEIRYQKSSKLGTSDKHLGPDSKYPCEKLEINYQKSSKDKQQTAASAGCSDNILSTENSKRKKRKRKKSDSPDAHVKKRSIEFGFDMQNNLDESPGNQRDQNKHDGNTQQETCHGLVVKSLVRKRFPPPGPEMLNVMKNIIFLDLDNWAYFFQKLPQCLPEQTFVWGFFGGSIEWKTPIKSPFFDIQQSRGLFYLNDRCGRTKDAADVAIVYVVGKMDVLLPKHVPFTIVSGDKCFKELEIQMTARKIVIIDPHIAQKESPEMIFAMVNSVLDR